ncbi:MAG: glycosyltransferase family 2 protein [Candidatus Promineifilaceae bacterium]
MLDVAIIIVSWNVRDYLANCLRSVYTDLRRSELNGEIWVVDNASTDGTQAVLESLFSTTHLIRNETNNGFGAANNQAMREIVKYYEQAPRYFFLLNPDTLVRPGAMAHLIECLEGRPEAGVAGARLIYGDGRFQHSAFNFPGLAQLAFDLLPFPDRLYESRLNGRYPRSAYRPTGSPFEVDHTLGAAMMVRRDVAETTGGFDETYHMYCEEIDWCWRIREAGWTVYTVPQAEIVHYGGESTSQVPAQSIVNLWHSRQQLYHRHHKPATVVLASKLVEVGMRRKAKGATNPDIQKAYLKAADLWQNDHPTQPENGIEPA